MQQILHILYTNKYYTHATHTQKHFWARMNLTKKKLYYIHVDAKFRHKQYMYVYVC